MREASASDRPAGGVDLLFAGVIFLGAALLFLVQPMIGRMVLPRLGGSPAVWNTCLVFFQLVLLAGYVYADVLGRRRSARVQAGVHLVPLVGAALLLPLALPAGWQPAPDADPAGALLRVLVPAVGLPFAVLATTGPLLQRWYSLAGGVRAHDPYVLYAASNAGSLTGLLSYPLLVEPSLALRAQAIAWSIGFVAYAMGVCACGVVAARRPAPGAPVRTDGEEAVLDASGARARARERLWWLVLALVPSSLLLGTTQYISTDVAAVPLLWVLPLAVYLGSFIVAFAGTGAPACAWAARLFPLAAAGVALVMLLGVVDILWLMVGTHLALLACACTVCHGRLAAARPAAHRLTEYYLVIAAGGAIGGLLTALVAPRVFSGVTEYPLAIIGACLLRPAVSWWGGVPAASGRGSRALRWVLDCAAPVVLVAVFLAGYFVVIRRAAQDAPLGEWARAVVLGAGPALVLLLAHTRPVRLGLCVGAVFLCVGFQSLAEERTLLQVRTFFGVHRVQSNERDTQRWLMHGSTRHGYQFRDESARRTPLGYYHPDGPLGAVMRATAGPPGSAVGVIGLGTGAIAAYASPSRSVTFFEIDPAVAAIAQSADLFTYLADAQGDVAVVIGDGRRALRTQPPGRFRVLVADAFTSDAVPAHLLTREAVAEYLERVEPGGVVAMHITNRHLGLEPVLAAIAEDLGLHAIAWDDVPAPDAVARGHFSSHWVVLARRDEDLAGVRETGPWRRAQRRAGVRAWTDDYSNLVRLLRW